MMQKPRLVLIDSNALAHRAFHAYPDTLENSKGEKTNAIFGYFSMLLQIIDQLKPEHLICVFDAPGGNFRDKLYEKYKAQRAPMDKSLAEQIPKIIETLRTSNITTLSFPGFEADDVIGSIAKNQKYADHEKIVVTGDKDLFQIIGNGIKIYLAGNPFSNSKLHDEKSATEKLGFDVNHILTFKSIKGDPSDNIPGVAGIGDVGAIKLIQAYGDLDNIYNHIDEIKPDSLRHKLEQGREMAYLSNQLATIKTDIESLDIDIEKINVESINYNELVKFFDRFEFRSLSKKVAHFLTVDNKPKDTVNKNANSRINVKTVNDLEGLQKVILSENFTVIYADKQDDIFHLINKFVIVQKDKTFLVHTENFSNDQVKTLLKSIDSRKLTVILYDAKRMIHYLKNIGIEDFTFTHDLQLYEYVFGINANKDEKPQGIKQMDMFDEDPAFEIAEGIYMRAKNIVVNKTEKRDSKLAFIYEKIELPVQKIILEMERVGIKLNPEVLQKLSVEIEEMIIQIEKEIFEIADEKFNIASPKQLSHILFEKLGVKAGSKNKSGGYTTNEDFLLDNYHIPIIKLIHRFRELSKLQNTYVKVLPNFINKKTNRIHTRFSQTTAITGRLASLDPNLQNIPITSDLADRIREAFEAETGKIFVCFDYSQQELRLLAEFSEDDNLRDAFMRGFDIHSYTASKIFGKEMNEIDSNERRIAKTVNFGVVYGISSFGLARRLKISNTEAQKFINDFFQSYPKVKIYFDELVKKASQDGFVETKFGRRKPTDDGLSSSNYQSRMAMQREILNYPLQGSAADTIKMAMVKVADLVKEKYPEYAKLILQVHDEIIFEVNDQISDKVSDRLKNFISDVKMLMSHTGDYEVPMLVEAKIGYNWANINKYLDN